jgi:hypothetical protein
MDENSRERVARCRNLPQLLEVVSELSDELRWVSGGGRSCQKLAWDPQGFPVNKFRHRRLQVRFESCAHAEEGQSESVGPTLLRSAHDGGFQRPMHPLHKAVRCQVERRRAGKMYSAHAGQGVEEV